MHTQDKRPEGVRGEHTPTKEKPLSETQQGQSKNNKRIVPVKLYFIAKTAHLFINESVAMCVAVILIVGGGYGL
jgi:hypothetical protein